MALPDLIVLADVKSWLGLTDPAQTEDDALLAALIAAASAFIRSWCRRDFTVQPYIETRDGTGGMRLALTHTPVLSIDSLLIDGQPVPAAPAIGASGYFFTPTMLYLHGHRFRRGFGNVVISYRAGLVEIPADLQRACVELVGLRFRERDRIGLTSRAQAGETTAYSQADVPAPMRVVLDGYKRILPLCA